MPNDVIDRVQNLARQAHTNLGLDFTDQHGNPIIPEDDNEANDSDNESYSPDDEDDDDAHDSDMDDENYLHTTDNIPIAGVNDTNEIHK
jgi:hypothetical protein